LLDYAIVFVLGFVIAGLVSFSMLPVVWKRALRLTRRHLETGIPISMAEVRAGRDQIRAEAAIELRRLEARIEGERERRHAVMADNGRQSATIRRLAADIESKSRRLKQLEAGSLGEQAHIVDKDQEIATLKAELAAANVTIALRDDTLSDLRREINAAQMEIDGHRVEAVALKTKLVTAEDEAAQKQREIEELTAAGLDRDGRIALQSVDIGNKDAVVSALEAKVAVAERALAEKARAHEATQTELELRSSALMTQLRQRDAALAEREGRLAVAIGREAELSEEVVRLRNEAQRTAADLARGVDKLRVDRQAIVAQLEAARVERARLQSEVATLKREARESWLAIEADNRMLRAELTRIAAEIAHDAALRGSAALAPIDDLIAANDEPGLDQRGHGAGKPERREDRVEAPPG
jgi:chromosome segregation ATPase